MAPGTAPGNYRPESPPEIDAALAEGAKPKMGLKEIKEARKAANKARRDAHNSLKAAEKQVTELEDRQRSLTAELERPECYQSGRSHELNRELANIQEELHRAMEAWEELTGTLAESGEEDSSSEEVG